MDDNKLFLEDKQLINDILERHYYSYFRKGNKGIEIYLTGICRANCEYCYLKKNQKELYPTALHDYDTILTNLKMLLEWYKENHFTCNIDIFSAEWITTPLFEKVMDIIYEAFKDEKKYKPSSILTADNMQFFKDKELTDRVEYHIERLKEIGIYFAISVSIDGKYCDYGRTENDDEFYERLNNFMLKYRFLAHPMISSSNIYHWIKNYRWWQQTFDKRISNKLMTLEVRDGSWDYKSIGALIQYCDFLSDEIFYNRLQGDKKEFLRYVLRLGYHENGKFCEPTPYDPICFNRSNTFESQDGISCSLNGALVIRLGDLSLNICHRLSYEHFQIGKYDIVDGKMTELSPKNISAIFLTTHLKKSMLPHCENCKFQEVCIGHCLGASYEAYGNPLVPQKEVCDMYRAKLTFLIYKYNKLGIFEELDSIKDEISISLYSYIKDLIKDITQGEEQCCEK